MVKVENRYKNEKELFCSVNSDNQISIIIRVKVKVLDL